MSIAHGRSRGRKSTPRELQSGDRMSREEFHRIYLTLPEDFKAELIGGIVYVASPLKIPHGTAHPPLSTLFFVYAARTTGLETGDSTTTILGEDSEVQPDLYLRILPEYGGQSETEDEYVKGPPELVAEIAHSRRALALHAKKDEYARHGVREYIVVCPTEEEVRWFLLESGAELSADGQGVFRSRLFPGLWLDREALLALDAVRLLATLEEGLQSVEHGEFARALAARQGRQA
jgi:Uma2 family endonuclease